MTSLHDPPRCVRLKSMTLTRGRQSIWNPTPTGRVARVLVDVWLGYTPTRHEPLRSSQAGAFGVPDSQRASPKKLRSRQLGVLHLPRFYLGHQPPPPSAASSLYEGSGSSGADTIPHDRRSKTEDRADTPSLIAHQDQLSVADQLNGIGEWTLMNLSNVVSARSRQRQPAHIVPPAGSSPLPTRQSHRRLRWRQ